MKWTRASERLPEDPNDTYVIRKLHNYGIWFGRDIIKMDYKDTLLWLDESDESPESSELEELRKFKDRVPEGIYSAWKKVYDLEEENKQLKTKLSESSVGEKDWKVLEEIIADKLIAVNGHKNGTYILMIEIMAWLQSRTAVKAEDWDLIKNFAKYFWCYETGGEWQGSDKQFNMIADHFCADRDNPIQSQPTAVKAEVTGRSAEETIKYLRNTTFYYEVIEALKRAIRYHENEAAVWQSEDIIPEWVKEAKELLQNNPLSTPELGSNAGLRLEIDELLKELHATQLLNDSLQSEINYRKDGLVGKNSQDSPLIGNKLPITAPIQNDTIISDSDTIGYEAPDHDYPERIYQKGDI